MTTTTRKRPGAPPGNQNAHKAERRQRYQVTLPPDVATTARRIGSGNLSHGIALLVEFYRRKNN